jgi:hypothetical protein
MRKLFYFLAILFFVNSPICAQINDTLVANNSVQQIDIITLSDHFEDEEDFAPGLGLAVLVIFIFICVFAGVGIVLAIVVLSILFGLIAIGIISSSIFVGISKQSLSSGVKTFLVSFSAVCGLVLAIPIVWVLSEIMHWWSLATTLIIGSLSGLVAGILFGFFLFYVIRKFILLIKEKYAL